MQLQLSFTLQYRPHMFTKYHPHIWVRVGECLFPSCTTIHTSKSELAKQVRVGDIFLPPLWIELVSYGAMVGKWLLRPFNHDAPQFFFTFSCIVAEDETRRYLIVHQIDSYFLTFFKKIDHFSFKNIKLTILQSNHLN